MNRPSRDDDDGLPHPGWNQSPPALAGDLTTRQDLIGTVNARSYHDHKAHDTQRAISPQSIEPPPATSCPYRMATFFNTLCSRLRRCRVPHIIHSEGQDCKLPQPTGAPHGRLRGRAQNVIRVLVKYAKYVGPGGMLAVAFVDPGNYSTDIAAGVTYRFKLLFIVLLSNLIAIFLQSLCIRIGCVTGKNLAQLCKIHFPRWLNLFIYVFAEGAIIATDIAEVIGTAIALNLLFHIPLVAGCAISILDVLVILLVYRPGGSIRTLRIFELGVLALVLGVVICFCFQLSLITNTTVGEVFKGYLPSSAIVQSQGLYQSIGVLGATVMPHSLYLGTGIVQPRLFDLDRKARAKKAITSPSDATLMSAATDADSQTDLYTYNRTPLLSTVKSCIKYSTAELTISLFTFALFINSAILIIAGAELYTGPDSNADGSLFAIHDLLSTQVSKAAGVVFALALLLSGTSAGIICTISGQIVSEGHLTWDWVSKPWVRRLITRTVAITPSIIIAGAVGSEGLTAALEASQVALSIILPVVSGPVIWFTCFGRYMVVKAPVPESRPAGVPAAVEMCHREPTPELSPGAEKVQTRIHRVSIVLPDDKSSAAALRCRQGPSSVSTPRQAVDRDDDGDGVGESGPVGRGVSPTGDGPERPDAGRDVQTESGQTGPEAGLILVDTNMRNHWLVTILALSIWCLIVIMNIAALVFLGKGNA